MNYTKALAMCGAALVAATAITTTASPVDARPYTHPYSNVTVVAHPGDYLVRHVSYADLNLASNPDVHILNRRVDNAVNDVCTEVAMESYQFTKQECAGDSWDRARPQVYQAVRRAREIAATGSSSIAAVAITIGLGD
jgi:UrcA family protein